MCPAVANQWHGSAHLLHKMHRNPHYNETFFYIHIVN